MSQVTIDRIEDGSVRRTTQGWSIQRSAYVSGLTGSPSSILPRALTAPQMPQEGDPHPNVPAAKVTGHYAVGAGGGEAIVYITYESPAGVPPPTGGGQPTFVVTDDTSTRTTQTQMVGGKPLRVAWQAAGDPGGGDSIPDTLTIGVEEQVQDVTLWGVVSNVDVRSLRKFVGRVNANTWEDEPAGRWLFRRLTSETQDRGRTYAVTAVVSRAPEDRVWCRSGIMRHQDSGKFVTIAAADVARIVAAERSYPTDASRAPSFVAFNGAIVAYPYRIADFGRIFGITALNQ